MNSLGLTFAELMEVVRTCECIQIAQCTPRYFKDFVSERLAPAFPELAGKVQQLSAEQVHTLCDYVCTTHSLIDRKLS